MTALLLVDLQNDFMPGGSLEVKHGDQIIPVVQQLMQLPFDKILASRDWHPENHGSFAKNHHLPVGWTIKLDGISQVLWPVHCVQNTPGAEFHSGFDSVRADAIFSKGIDSGVDSYSTFFDNEKKRSTGLADYLAQHQIKTLYIAGLAVDYCVKYSALDAIKLNYKTFVIIDATRGVNLQAEDSRNALEEMSYAGVQLIHSSNVVL